MRRLRERETEDECEHEQTKKVLNFLSHARWVESKREEGGITWLELYIYFRIHAGASDTDPFAQRKLLETEIADFKKRCGRSSCTASLWLMTGI